MVEKKYDHLVKPAKITEDTRGLYSSPRVWMESDELVGFGGHFSYGFIKEQDTVHPKEGTIVHPYDEVLVFAGLNFDDILDLGAEISVVLGEEGEKHTFDKPSVVVVPAGTPHGPVTIENIDRPIAHYHIGLAPEYEAEKVEIDSVSSGSSNYNHLIKDLKTYVDEKFNEMMPGFAEYTDDRGVTHQREVDFLGPGNADQLVWVFGKDLEGLEVNFPWAFYTKPGTWDRLGQPHTHEGGELLFFGGLDPEDIHSLGAELEIALGKEKERHIIEGPTVVICPEDVPHNPLTTRWVEKPFTHTSIYLNSEYNVSGM